MWLLSTDHAELHYFTRSFEAPGGYAILSHTWDKAEQTLQDVRAIGERCRANGTNPRDDPQLSTKIKECCKLAETHGYHWIWVDFCCIDQTSSSELSEAINSMYNWYKAAEVCFAYLKDVPSDDDVSEDGSAFRKSRWHTRGWTLQELIAPESVIFVSNSWHEIGERAMLAEVLEEITKVPARLLTGDSSPAQFSACARLSWASSRETKRVEDEAYCLMGLFGVSMPTNYGEGRRAFIRLQHEIMQADCDLSLFAFGARLGPNTLQPPKDQSVDPMSFWNYLLADSPRKFQDPYSYIPDRGRAVSRPYPPPSSTDSGPFDAIELPMITITSYGVQCRLPLVKIDDIAIVVTLCQLRGRNFGLLLTNDTTRDPTRPRYFTGYSSSDPDTGAIRFIARMCDLGDDLYHLTFNGQRVKAEWTTIYIVPTPSHFRSENATSTRLSIDSASQFRVPRWLVDRIAALGFQVNQPITDTNSTTQVIQLIRQFELSITIFLGSCTSHRHDAPNHGPLPWSKAYIALDPVTLHEPELSHDCAVDHLDSDSWTTHSSDLRTSEQATCSKEFSDSNGERIVRLSFVRFAQMSPKESRGSRKIFVMHLELCGIALKKLLHSTGITFPSLSDIEKTFPR